MIEELGVEVIARSTAEHALERHRSTTLGVVGFGRRSPEVPREALGIHVPLRQLGGDPALELWRSETSTIRFSNGLVDASASRDWLFGSVRWERGDIEQATQRAFSTMLGFARDAGYSFIQRIWATIPSIDRASGGLDEYMRFSRGRAHAIESFDSLERAVCASTAVGSSAAHATLHFLSSHHPGQHFENPRQTSAYHYPPRYGPKPPLFARATRGSDGSLFVSGTASVLGSETQHAASFERQFEVAVANLREVLKTAGIQDAEIEPNSLSKIYLADESKCALLRNLLEEAGLGLRDALILGAKICRPDLLLEIECCVKPRL